MKIEPQTIVAFPDAMRSLKQTQDAIGEVLKYRVGDLPGTGYIRDTDASRAAIARLAELSAK